MIENIIIHIGNNWGAILFVVIVFGLWCLYYQADGSAD